MTLVQFWLVRFGWHISSKDDILKGSGEVKILLLLLLFICPSIVSTDGVGAVVGCSFWLAHQ